jgi:hypothetical protein
VTLVALLADGSRFRRNERIAVRGLPEQIGRCRNAVRGTSPYYAGSLRLEPPRSQEKFIATLYSVPPRKVRDDF